MTRPAFAAVLAAALGSVTQISVAAPTPPALRAKMFAAEQKQSDLLAIVHLLADRLGPRLTGSANERAARDWAMARLRSYGLSNVHEEPWNFAHDGWVSRSATGAIIDPVRQSLVVAPAAWTPSTDGPITASAVIIDPPLDSAAAVLRSYLEAVRARVSGKIVLVGKGDPLPPDLSPGPRRWTAANLRRMLDPKHSSDPESPKAGILTFAERDAQINAFLRSGGALVRVDNSQLPEGLLAAPRNRSITSDDAVPSVALRAEDYGRIARLLADGLDVKLRFNLDNSLDSQGRISANVIAEVPGTDLKDQVVMFGAHLDSWHVATGATDDAVGCAIMMEAVRLIMRLQLHPRRTLRIALWTGEEQGLLGSQDYVARHFGTAEAPKPDFGTLAAYINIDGGTGRVRGLNVFGPLRAGTQLAAIVKPLAGEGVVGAVPHHVRRMGSTDATTFSRAGLTAIGVIQDPVDIGTGAYHSSIDTYDHVIEPDARQAAAVMAFVIYELANRDQPLARFPTTAMPPPLSPPPQARLTTDSTAR